MGGRRRTPVYHENFSANLEAIRLFLGPEGEGAFAHLLDHSLDEVAPTLCRFPQAGRSVLAYPIRSLEARAHLKRLRTLLRPHGELREFIVDDYLISIWSGQPRWPFLPSSITGSSPSTSPGSGG